MGTEVENFSPGCYPLRESVLLFQGDLSLAFSIATRKERSIEHLFQQGHMMW